MSLLTIVYTFHYGKHLINNNGKILFKMTLVSPILSRQKTARLNSLLFHSARPCLSAPCYRNLSLCQWFHWKSQHQKRHKSEKQSCVDCNPPSPHTHTPTACLLRFRLSQPRPSTRNDRSSRNQSTNTDWKHWDRFHFGILGSQKNNNKTTQFAGCGSHVTRASRVHRPSSSFFFFFFLLGRKLSPFQTHSSKNIKHTLSK